MPGVEARERRAFAHPARLFEAVGRGTVRCHLCQRRCRIAPGERGWCGVRVNRSGRLYTLNYGNLSALESRPIEVKPLFHYYPGSTALTLSGWSCNLGCPWCQNHRLSNRLPPERPPLLLSPQEVVRLAAGDRGVCVSLNEPTLLFEFCEDLFGLARLHGLYRCLVSNGCMTEEALEALVAAGLDGMNVDVKGDQGVYDRFCGGLSVSEVWRIASLARRLGVHVEIVCLLVTGVSDGEPTLRWLVEQHLEWLGPEVPLHFTRYFPAHRFTASPTPLDRLELARRLALRAGVRYVYLGNVGWGEDTHCPGCGRVVIARRALRVVRCDLEDGRCPRCGTPIAGVGLKGVAASEVEER